MTSFSIQNNFYGKFQPKESRSKKKISPVLERENPAKRNLFVLNYNNQRIPILPLRKPHSVSMPNIANTSIEKPKFLKEKSQILQRKPQFLKEKPLYVKEKPQILKEKHQLFKEKQPFLTDKSNFLKETRNKTPTKRSHPALKERLKLYEIQITKSSNRVNDILTKAHSGDIDILSGISVCKSARYLQKYGCLHKDPVCGRKSN